MTESAELTRAIVLVVELVQQYGPTVGAVVTTLLAKKAVKHARQASTDAKAASAASSSAARRANTAVHEAHGAPAAAPTPAVRQITDSGIIRVFGYLDKRIAEVDKRKGRHADEDAGMDSL